MRAVICNAFTGSEDLRIGEVEEPKPAGDEILIDVHAASVSFMDNLIVSGLYQMRPPTPFVPGPEAPGVVIGVGEKVTRFRPGDRVACESWTGGYAERMIAKEWMSVRFPPASLSKRRPRVCKITARRITPWSRGHARKPVKRCLSVEPRAGLASPPSTSPAIWACASSPVSAPTTRQVWCAGTVPAMSSTIGAKTCAS